MNRLLLALTTAALTLLFLAPTAGAKDAVDFFGGNGTLGGQFNSGSNDPRSVTVNETGAGPANAGDIYALDGANNRIERFGRDDNGTPADSVDDTYFFISAWGADVVSAGGTGDVGDAEAKAYEICTDAAQCQAAVASSGNGSLSGNGALASSNAIAIDPDTGNVYVADTNGTVVGFPKNYRVNVYDGTGTFLRSFGFDVDATTAGTGYEVCPATDVCKIGLPGAGTGQIEVGNAGIAVSLDGNPATGTLYLADGGNQRVNTYALDGTSPGSIGSAAIFQVGFPQNLALDSRGILYAENGVAGGSGSKIERYDTQGVNGPVGFLAPLRSSASEIQRVLPNATAGQFRLSFDPDGAGPEPAQTTADIPYNANRTTVRAALEALPAIGAGNVITDNANNSDGHYDLFFTNALANADVAQLTVSNGTAPLTGSISVTTAVEGFGGGGANETQKVTVAANKGTFRLNFDPDGAGPEPAETTQDIPYNWPIGDFGNSNSVINTVMDALRALPSIPDTGVEGTFSSGPGDATGSNPYRITFQNGLGAQDVAQLTCTDGSTPLSGGAGCSVATAIPGQSGLIPSNSISLAVDPDEDGAGPDSDVLYIGVPGAIQQFGPTNAPGLSAPPADDDARHGTGPAFGNVQALAAEPATGRLYAGAGGFEGPGVYVLDDVSPNPPEGSLDSIDEVAAHGFTANATIDPNGAPDTSYRFEYVTDAAYQASSNERQVITLNQATGGTFTLSFSGLTSAALAFDASAASVEAALEALPSIAAGNVSVSGAFGGPYTVEFIGDLAESDQSQLGATSALTPAQASINVQTNTNGRAKDRFLNAQSTPTVLLGHQEDPQAIAQRIEPPGPGLLPNTTYHVRLLFQRRFSTEQQSVELTQATLTIPPDLETAGSSLRTTTTATLLGRVLPNGLPTTYHFQYGTQGPCDSNPCTESAPIDAGSGQQIELASQALANLDPDTTYHYRIAASNGVGGTVFGEDRTLTTRATDAPLSHGEFPGPPDSDRAYEMVSMPDTSGNPANGFVSTQAYAADGNRVIYTVLGGTPISDQGNIFAPYMAERPPGQHPTTGWQTRLPTPPRAELRSQAWAANLPGADDLSSLIAVNGNPQLNEEPIFWRLNAHGPAEKLFDVRKPTETIGVSQSGESGAIPYETSADASRVIATLQRGTIDPAFPAATETPNLYDISDGGTPQLVSLMPAGQPPACGVARGREPGELQTPRAGWVSEDGSRVYFNSSGDNCTAAPQLYERNLLTAQSKLISGPVISGTSCSASLILSTQEEVFFTTQSRLDPDDVAPASCSGAAADNDVYRYDLADDSLECLTCLTDGLPADVIGDSLNELAIDPAATRLYFSTQVALLPGVPTPAIYRLEIASGDLAYVAPDTTSHVGPIATSVDLSSDGRFLSFYSNNSLLDPLGGGFQNGDKPQHYLYDDERRSLICASCPPDGAAPLAAAIGESAASPFVGSPGITALAEDGTLIFATDTPLTAADQNTAAGPSSQPGRDVYEFRDGRPLLITDGLTAWPDSSFTGPKTLAISPSGRDVFFTAAARYTSDALDGQRRVYDARIGGGIDFPPDSLPPCDLNSGACEGPASDAPDTPGAGSAVFEGPGNQPAAKEKRCPKGKRKTRRKGKVRCVKPRKHAQRKHQRAAKHDRRAHR